MDKPRTVGELRRLLARFPARYQGIDPKFKDSDPVPPTHPGGKQTIPPVGIGVPTADAIATLLSKRASNSFLTQRRIGQGLLGEPDSGDSLPKPRIVPGGALPGPLPSPLPTPPSSVDWRDRFGWPWITSLQTQLCNDCWCFMSAALIEAMVRIEHCVWFKGSEASMRWGCNASCTSDGTPDESIPWVINNGLCDEQCVPYSNSDTPEIPCADKGGRSVRLVSAGYFSLPRTPQSGQSPGGPNLPADTNYQMTKVWLDLCGPVGVFFDPTGLPLWTPGTVFYRPNESGTATTTAGTSQAGQPVLNVASTAGFAAQDNISINPGQADQEAILTIKSVNAGSFTLYNNLLNNHGAGEPVNLNLASPGHFVLIVGYDDSLGDSGAWICKNSYGAQGWNGNGGYFYLGYGTAGSEIWGHGVLYLTSPDPWSKRRLHGGSLLEGENGSNHMNFDAITIPGDGSLAHYTRDNDSVPYPWNKADTVPSSDAVGVGWPALAETTFNRNLELVYTTTNQTLHHWWYEQGTGLWRDGGVFGPVNAIGAPGFIQSNFGQNAATGNFEVVVLDSYEQLEHWSRDNSGPPYPWQQTATFGSNVAFSGPAFIQSHYGTQGNFELVCVLMNGQMQHWFRDNDAPDPVWAPSTTFGSNITSAPCMIEGNYGAGSEYAIGNFELCVAAGGYLQHWYRQNNGDGQWHGPTIFGDGHELFVVGLVQSSFGFNLELLASRDDGHIQHYWRDSTSLEWFAGEFVV